jgi:hypothetical protein
LHLVTLSFIHIGEVENFRTFTRPFIHTGKVLDPYRASKIVIFNSSDKTSEGKYSELNGNKHLLNLIRS